jgi:hypothetical protein
MLAVPKLHMTKLDATCVLMVLYATGGAQTQTAKSGKCDAWQSQSVLQVSGVLKQRTHNSEPNIPFV